MNINVTTYVDNEKLLFEKNRGLLEENEKAYIITYTDRSNINFQITIAKDNKSVVINKDKVDLLLKEKKLKTNYKTDFGVISLDTKIKEVKILAKNQFIQFEISYKIYFSAIDSQENKLKILVKRK